MIQVIAPDEQQMQKLAAESADGNTSTKFHKITKLDPAFTYVRFRAIGCIEVDGPNSNFDAFPYMEFEDERPNYGYKSFENKRAFIEHNSSNVENSIGSLYGSYLNRFDFSKVASAAQKWSELDDDQRLLVLSSRNTEDDGSIEVLMGIDKKLSSTVARMIETDAATGCSMGTNIDYSECSVCGNRAYFESQYCGHIKHSKGSRVFVEASKLNDLVKKGTLKPEWMQWILTRENDRKAVANNSRRMVHASVFEINYGLSFFELSVVANPAYNRGYKLEKIAATKLGDRQLIPMIITAKGEVEVRLNVNEEFFQQAVASYENAMAQDYSEWGNQDKVELLRDSGIARAALSSGAVNKVLVPQIDVPNLQSLGFVLEPAEHDPGFYEVIQPEILFNQTFASVVAPNNYPEHNSLYPCSWCKKVIKRGPRATIAGIPKYESFKTHSICSVCADDVITREDTVSKLSDKTEGGIAMAKKPIKEAEYTNLPSTVSDIDDKGINVEKTEVASWKEGASMGSNQIEKEKETRPTGTIFTDAITANKAMKDVSADLKNKKRVLEGYLDFSKRSMDFMNDKKEDKPTDKPKDNAPPKPAEKPDFKKEFPSFEAVEIGIDGDDGGFGEDIDFGESVEPTEILENVIEDLETVLTDLGGGDELMDDEMEDIGDVFSNKRRWSKKASENASTVFANVNTIVKDAEKAIIHTYNTLSGLANVAMPAKGGTNMAKNVKTADMLTLSDEDIERMGKLANIFRPSKTAEFPFNKDEDKDDTDDTDDEGEGGEKEASVDKAPKVAGEGKADGSYPDSVESEMSEDKYERFERKPEEKKKEAKLEAKEATAQPPTGARDPGDYGDPGGIESIELNTWWNVQYPQYEKMKEVERRTTFNDADGRVDLLTGIVAKRITNPLFAAGTYYGVYKIDKTGKPTEGFITTFAATSGGMDKIAADKYSLFTSGAYLDRIVSAVKAEGIEAARKGMNGVLLTEAQMEGLTPGKTEKVNPLYDSQEEGKDSNKAREGLILKDAKDKANEKAYYTEAYGDAGYAAEQVKKHKTASNAIMSEANGRIAAEKRAVAAEARVQELEDKENARILVRRATDLARRAASVGLIPFDRTSISKQAKTYLDLDDVGYTQIANTIKQLPVVESRAITSYQIPEAENMANGIIHNELNGVNKVREEHTAPERTNVEGIQNAVENSAVLTSDSKNALRRKVASVVPQMSANASRGDEAQIPDFTKRFSTVGNALRKKGQFESCAHMLNTQRNHYA